MDISDCRQSGRCKDRFASGRPLPESIIDELCSLACLGQPSQRRLPWHVMVASSLDAKRRINAVVSGTRPFAPCQLHKASHIVVLCARTGPRRAADDGALPTAVPGHHAEYPAAPREHAAEQAALAGASHPIYMALGALLLGAATLNLATCTVDDFDADWLDAELGLAERGWRSVVMVGLGQHAAGDIEPPSLPLPTELFMTRL